jgi:hypothetical protein
MEKLSMRRVVASIGGLALGVALSQFPEYAQQYTQRLGGAVDELRVVTEKFDRDAQDAGLDRQQALTRFETSPDQFLAGRGTSEAANFARYEQLSTTLARIQNANAVERFQMLPAYFDTDIGRRTLENYLPALPVTVEGILYAGGGFLVGFLVLSGLWRFLAMPFKKRYPAYR